MAENFKPLALDNPKTYKRKHKSRNIQFKQELIDQRKIFARTLVKNIRAIDNQIAKLSPEQRKAVFLKIEHNQMIPLVGTGLKAISDPDINTTLAILTRNDLSKLREKIESFGNDPLKKGHVRNERLGFNLRKVKRASHLDRLSESLRKDYPRVSRRNRLLYEVELFTPVSGKNQIKSELQRYRTELKQFLSKDHVGGGTIFEHEDSIGKGSCRLVVASSGKFFKKLLLDIYWQSKIIWVDARPEFQTFSMLVKDFEFSKLGNITGPSEDSSLVCVVDSGINSGNQFLAVCTKNDLEKSYISTSPSDNAGHGSGVASLVAYENIGIADGYIHEANVWVCNAKILDHFGEIPAEEDDGKLFSKLLESVVKDFKERGVNIFNLSVNIKNRHWCSSSKKTVRKNSWVARKIDALSRKYDVTFVISAGNLTLEDLTVYKNDGLEYPQYLLKEKSRVLDPGQAALAITVGSIAPSETVLYKPEVSVVTTRNLPSPFTRSGPGINGELKPDVVEYGGNVAFNSTLSSFESNPGLNVLYASNKLSPTLNHGIGTSFAAPKVAHHLAKIQQEYKRIFGVVPTAHMLKALLINCSSYPCTEEEFHKFSDELKLDKNEDPKNIFGYGRPNHRDALACTSHNVLLVKDLVVPVNYVSFIEIPVPAELELAVGGTKRLSITVSFAPEVQRWGLENYFGTTLKWRLFRGDIDTDRIVNSMTADDSHVSPDEKLPNELDYNIGFQKRSRGAIQHDYCIWRNHSDAYSKNPYILAVATYEKWGRENPPGLPVAVVARLEDQSGTVEIYSRIQVKLKSHALVGIPVRVRS